MDIALASTPSTSGDCELVGKSDVLSENTWVSNIFFVFNILNFQGYFYNLIITITNNYCMNVAVFLQCTTVLY